MSFLETLDGDADENPSEKQCEHEAGHLHGDLDIFEAEHDLDILLFHSNRWISRNFRPVAF